MDLEDQATTNPNGKSKNCLAAMTSQKSSTGYPKAPGVQALLAKWLTLKLHVSKYFYP